MNHTMTGSVATSQTSRPKVFYDGGCPLCRREIAHYQRLDTEEHIHWVDIHAQPDALREHNLSWEPAMQRLHLLDTDGRMLTGAYAFAALWRNLPYYRRLATILALPGTLALLDRLYNRFATWRWNRRCDAACDFGGRDEGAGNGS